MTGKRNRNINGAATNAAGEKDGYCGHCNHPVRSEHKGLRCDYCDKWYHSGCQDVSLDEYKLYIDDKHRARWSCIDCNSEYKNLKKAHQQMKDENNQLKKVNSEFVIQLAKLSEKIDDMKQQIKNEVYKDLLEEMDEKIDRENRKNNVILFNIKEVQNETKQQRDTLCWKALQYTEVDLDEDSVVEVVRLGRLVNQGMGSTRSGDDAQNEALGPNIVVGPPRPLLVKLRSVDLKWAVVKNSKKLKSAQDEEYKKVKIVPDQTLREKERYKQLKNELQERLDAGETNLFIRDGKIQKRNFQTTYQNSSP